MTELGQKRRRMIILFGFLLTGVVAGVLFGNREISQISEGLSINHPEDPQDGLTFIFYGFVFLGGLAGLGLGWMTGALVDGRSRKDADGTKL